MKTNVLFPERFCNSRPLFPILAAVIMATGWLLLSSAQSNKESKPLPGRAFELVKLYYSASSNAICAEIECHQDAELKTVIKNSNGRDMYRGTISLKKGYHVYAYPAGTDLEPGVYFINVYLDHGYDTWAAVIKENLD
ncbi:MAG: hypothetical protein AB1458_10895 [Bacteroidota bacterium]